MFFLFNIQEKFHGNLTQQRLKKKTNLWNKVEILARINLLEFHSPKIKDNSVAQSVNNIHCEKGYPVAETSKC